MTGPEQINDTASERPQRETDGIGLPSDIPCPRNGIFNLPFGSFEDPTSPYSLPWLHKWVIIVLVASGTLCVTCASSIYTTIYTQMNAELEVSSLVATIGLSFFVLGFALGPLLTSPLSEWYGRRPIYLASLISFTIWNIMTAVARNIQTMLVARLLAGIAGGTFLTVSGATVGDLFLPDQIQIPMTVVSSAPFIGPCLGPLIGGFISHNVDWRWNFYFVVIWSGCLLVGFVLFVPETYRPIKVKAKAEGPREEKGDEPYPAPLDTTHTAKSKALALSLLRPFQLLFFEPMCLALDLYSAIMLGILYLFFQAFPLLFRVTYGFNLWQVGLTFLGMILGIILAAASTPLWHQLRERLVKIHESESSEAIPEYRLVTALPGSVLVSVGLFWFAWTISPDIHWIVPVLGSAIFGCGMLLTFAGIFTFLVDAYPQYAASALAGNTLTRCSFGAAFPLFGIQMYHKLGFHWASSLIAFLTVAMIPFPWLFLKYGKKLRAESRYSLRS